MANTNYDTTHDVIFILQQVKGKTKLKLYQTISEYYDEMKYRRKSRTFQFEEDVFSKNAEVFSKNYHEVLLLLNFLQTKPQIRCVKYNCYDFCYTGIKIRNDKEIVNDENENNKDYINFEDLITPNIMLEEK